MADEKKNTWLSQDFLSRLLNYSGFVIIFTVILCFIIIASCKSCSSPKESHPGVDIKKIQFVAVPKLAPGKSVLVSENLFKELQVTTDSINKNIKKFEEIKQEIVAIEELNKDDMKFYLTVLGSIIAIVGFFGFKSIHDTRESSIKFATDEAKLTAKGIAMAEAKDAIKIEHQEWTTKIDTVTKNYDDIKTLLSTISDLETEITNLKIRVNDLEGEDDVAMDNEIVNDESTSNSGAEDLSISNSPENEDPDNNSEDIDPEDKFADK
ncbi:hypothetical protein ACI6PS_07800 [Flavobacterium sp. PLA-1-15]|uniref:hypothetical protein n=1 Tax=Flavobacterium sp. PLA-1-15 TaxID=3380533 RepID=UPI003B765CA7